MGMNFFLFAKNKIKKETEKIFHFLFFSLTFRSQTKIKENTDMDDYYEGIHHHQSFYRPCGLSLGYEDLFMVFMILCCGYLALDCQTSLITLDNDIMHIIIWIWCLVIIVYRMHCFTQWAKNKNIMLVERFEFLFTLIYCFKTMALTPFILTPFMPFFMFYPLCIHFGFEWMLMNLVGHSHMFMKKMCLVMIPFLFSILISMSSIPFNTFFTLLLESIALYHLL